MTRTKRKFRGLDERTISQGVSSVAKSVCNAFGFFTMENVEGRWSRIQIKFGPTTNSCSPIS